VRTYCEEYSVYSKHYCNTFLHTPAVLQTAVPTVPVLLHLVDKERLLLSVEGNWINNSGVNELKLKIRGYKVKE
jgi:hypothetical protein